MGALGLLQFAVKVFVHFLAWPLLALGYPICASIKAIEANSVSDTKTLNIYWVVFSLVLLFEHAFVKPLQWFPFWPYIRLMLVCWLVIPDFGGASYVYKHLICSGLSLYPQIVINWFNKRSESSFKRLKLVAEVVRFLKENGAEALEKLIASKVEEIKGVSCIEKEVVDKVNQKEPNLVRTENRTDATRKIKETVAEIAAGREVVPQTSASKPDQNEWTFSTCNVTSSTPSSLVSISSYANVSIDAKEAVSTSSIPSPIVPSSSTFSGQAPEPLVPPSAPSPTIYSKSKQPTKSELHPSPKSDADTSTIAQAVQIGPSTGGSDVKLKPSVSTSPIETKTELQPLKLDADTTNHAPAAQLGPSTGETEMKLKASFSTTPTIKSSPEAGSASLPIFGNNLSPAAPATNLIPKAQPEQSSSGPAPFPTQFPTSGSFTGGKSLDVPNTNEDEMDEEAPETNNITEPSLGSLGVFGLGSAPNPTASKTNPFGGSFGTPATSVAASPFSVNIPSGELFKPASFNFQPQQQPQASQPPTSSLFSGGFGNPTISQAPTSGFGQPTQIGQGQQALGSVLGAFGQSRQIGTGLPVSGFGSPNGFGSGFAGANSASGFSNAVAGGGFASFASTGGGFANLASGGGGFGSLASGGGGGRAFASVPSGAGGFANVGLDGRGFVGVAPSGGAFRAFSSQATGGFSAFGSDTGTTEKPPELFTQMRK